MAQTILLTGPAGLIGRASTLKPASAPTPNGWRRDEANPNVGRT